MVSSQLHCPYLCSNGLSQGVIEAETKKGTEHETGINSETI